MCHSHWEAWPLGEGGSAVGAPSLPQGEAADEPEGEQDDGQEDTQEGEGVLQNPDPAGREAALAPRATSLRWRH